MERTAVRPALERKNINTRGSLSTSNLDKVPAKICVFEISGGLIWKSPRTEITFQFIDVLQFKNRDVNFNL